MRQTLAAALVLIAGPAFAGGSFSFDSLDGGTYDSADWAGHPVLVVNTASLCGFTPQYEGLQDLHERYGAEGLIVLAVPSDDFKQELATDAQVKDFCAMTFDLTLPMTTITPVRGDAAHPFYRWLAEDHGFTPSWNFNKVLIAPDGSVAATFGSMTKPLSTAITGAIETMLSAD
ncbi:glutathione peroxidase [Psychromarinibacter sp. S121]|uniref:glutathione peroxidase n=1 Tax=Psychromarinibacter sp. S121 TaxID=3415127 RepID=UPI003C7C86F4